MKDKLIEALKNQKKWYEQNGGGWPDDDHAIIYLAAKSTLTPPDTQGAVDALANCEVISRGGKYLLLSYDNAQKIERALTRPSREAKLLNEIVSAYNDLHEFFDVDNGTEPDGDSIGWQGDMELPTTFGQLRRLKQAIAEAGE